MKQKKIILENVSNENTTTTLPASVRLYSDNEGNMLQFKDGAIPFFLKLFTYDNGTVISEFEGIQRQIIVKNRRLSKNYFTQNFWVYKIADYGSQNLTFGLKDFIPLAFDSTGAKISQHKIALIRNYTTKEVFMLYPKTETETTLTVFIEPKNSIKTLTQDNNERELVITRDNAGAFIINLFDEDLNISSIQELDVYVNGSRLLNSEYMFSFTKGEIPVGDTIFVAKQQSFFKSLVREEIEKLDSDIQTEIHNIDISLNDNLKDVNEITIKSRGTEKDVLYVTTGVTGVFSMSQFNFETIDDIEIYKVDTGVKLIPGYDFYINQNKEFVLYTPEVSNYEVFFKTDNFKKIRKVFTGTTAYDLIEGLYYGYINDWKVDVNESTITIFEDGKFYKKGNQTTLFTSGNKYEIIVEDIALNDALSIPVSDNSTAFEVDLSAESFDNFNEYILPTDPNFNYEGQNFISTSLFDTQEVFLYDDSLDMLLAANEPRITTNGLTNDYLIQDLVDPYDTASMLSGILTKYTEYQSPSDIVNKLHVKLSTSNFSNIDTDLNTIKDNLLDSIANSTITYTAFPYSTGYIMNNDDFMFLIIKKGVDAKDINITYYTDVNDYYHTTSKKEYNCSFNGDNLFLSVPIHDSGYIKIKNYDGTNFKGSYYKFK